MSTASRYRETVCSARAGNRNAVFVPGVSVKTRRHYDLRAARQAREPKGLHSERNTEAEIAALASRAFMPHYHTGSREPWLRHSPPFLRPPPHQLEALP